MDDPPPRVTRRRAAGERRPASGIELNGYASVQVNVDALGLDIVGDAANEPSLAVDPTNPLNIVVGWRQFDDVSSNFRQAGWAYSHDGGLTWTFPGVLEPGVFRSDPVLDVDHNGRFYFYSLNNDFTADVWRSDDAGANWLPPVAAYGADKTWIAVDRNREIGDGNVYVSWGGHLACFPCGDLCCSTPPCFRDHLVCGPSVCCDTRRISRSQNGGSTFEEPVLATQPPFDPGAVSPAVISPNLAVGTKGELYHAGGVRRIGVSGGFEFSVARTNANQQHQPLAFGERVIVDLGGAYPCSGDSADCGFPNPGGLVGQAEIAVDHSKGRDSGNVYLLSSVDPPGPDPLDVHFSRSEDHGRSWSTSVRVNDDPLGANAHQWFATFSVAPTGRIDAVWNDTRNSNGDATISQLFYSYSYDSGRTWAPNIAVTPQWNSHIGWPNQNKIGDYYDIVSGPHTAGVSYAATFNGGQDIYFVTVFPDCDRNGIPDGIDLGGGSRARNLCAVATATE